MEIYVVKQNDTVDKIAMEHGTRVESVIYNNQLVSPYRLAVGQALLLSSGSLQEEDNWPDLVSGGYAYPFISPWVLEETMPYLSELMVFSYGFTIEGNLVFPTLDDTWMIEEAERFGTMATLTLTPLGEDGSFNNQLISELVNNRAAIQNLIRQLGRVMLEKGYRGLNLDFEYILSEDRVAYADFVRSVTGMMNLFGFHVSVTLAPKTSDDQPGVLYEGMDYALLGDAANSVLLMTYEWGYTYGPPMAVAPIEQVRRVVEYAITRIPHEKISLGIPNYGYDWALPFEKGVTRARTLGNIEAVGLALDQGRDIQFDPVARSPWFRYWQYGIQHEVWFEDVRSYLEKFKLIKEFQLRGAGYWQLMQLFRANWLLMEEMFRIKKNEAGFGGDFPDAEKN